MLKALALGADAVAIGRPVILGLAAAGERGVGRVLGVLREEIEHAPTLWGSTKESATMGRRDARAGGAAIKHALTLCGCASLDDLGPGMVRWPW